MRVVITGGTGLLGRLVVASLAARDHHVVVITRSRAKAAALAMRPGVFVEDGDVTRPGPWTAAVSSAEAVIHLAGPPISSLLGGPTKEKSFATEKMRGVAAVFGAIKQAPVRPRLLMLASSTMIYGARPDTVDERGTLGSDGPAAIFRAVEEAAAALRPGTRVVPLRFPQLLAPGDALAQVTDAAALPAPSATPFSFVHVADAASLIMRVIGSAHDGPLNVVAAPTTIAGVHKALRLPPPPSGLGRLFKKPAEVAPVALLAGQAVRSEYARLLDFYATHESIDAALKACRAHPGAA